MDPENENFKSTKPQPDEKSSKKFRKRKRSKILRACQNHDVDKLVDLATTRGGLLHDELRRDACKGTPAAQSIPCNSGNFLVTRAH